MPYIAEYKTLKKRSYIITGINSVADPDPLGSLGSASFWEAGSGSTPE